MTGYDRILVKFHNDLRDTPILVIVNTHTLYKSNILSANVSMYKCFHALETLQGPMASEVAKYNGRSKQQAGLQTHSANRMKRCII